MNPSAMLDRYKGSESILVADDEPVVLALAKTILKMHGYNVHLATNGAEALKLHNTTVPIDLLLTDVIMPQLSGPELAHVLKQQVESLRCVFMSGYNPEQIRSQGAPDVGCDYLRKPFTPEALLKKVRETLDA